MDVVMSGWRVLCLIILVKREVGSDDDDDDDVVVSVLGWVEYVEEDDISISWWGPTDCFFS